MKSPVSMIAAFYVKPIDLSSMKSIYLSILTFCLPLAGFVNAQEDTAMHRKVYSEIQEGADKMKQEKATAEIDGLEFELNGWRQDGKLRKIVARVPGEDGDGSEEYYFNDGNLLFVFRQYAAAAEDGKKGAQVEDRFYLKGGALFKWLGYDKQPVPIEDETFKLEGERLAELSTAFVAAFDKKPAPAVAAEMTGVFLGIEEGDYSHWRMKNEKGEEISLFILKPEPSVEAVMDKPDGFVGKPCKVTWKKSMETIPEAGGKIEVEQVFGVKWHEK